MTKSCFSFNLFIGQFVISANVNSTLIATWKRSQESISSEPVEMVAGKVNFNQTLKHSFNLNYQEQTKVYEEKKTLLSFTLKTPKGDKTAGFIQIDLAEIVNNNKQIWENKLTIEKCPIKDSSVFVRVTYQLEDPLTGDPKDLQIQKLTRMVKKLEQEKKIIENKYITIKEQNETMKEEIVKYKNIQHKLEDEANQLRDQNNINEIELQKIRIKFENAYDTLCSNLANMK